MKAIHLTIVLTGLLTILLWHQMGDPGALFKHVTSPTKSVSSAVPKSSMVVNGSVAFNLQNGLPHILLEIPAHLERTKKQPGVITTYQTRGGPVMDDRLAVGIRYRGSSSYEHYPKKSYGIELLDEGADAVAEGLLDLPPGKDWSLYAPYGDKTLIRNVFAYNLFNLMGRYAPRTRLVTLDLKDDVGTIKPAGIYVLIERIKFAPERLAITKKAHKHRFAYLMRFDPIKNRQFVKTDRNSYILISHPTAAHLDEAARAFITNYLNQFERELFSTVAAEFQRVTDRIDIDALVDFVILQELSRNIDAYRRSCYFYLPIDGRLTFGPPWDFEKTFGNVDRYDGFKPEGFQFNNEGGVGWFARLMTLPAVKEALKRRWTLLRGGPLADKALTAVIDEQVHVIPADVVAENFKIWPILGVKVWLNNEAKSSYSEEVVSLKEWTLRRAAWLDTAIPAL